LEKAGMSLGAREIELGPEFTGLIDAQIAIMGAEAARALKDKPEAEISGKLREFLRAGREVTADRLRAAREQAERCRRALDAIFEDLDAILTPAAVGEAPPGLDATGDPVFCRIWTLLGVPCVSLPILQGPSGLPVGLQVVGRRGADDRLVSSATSILRHSRA
jgi:Asp-tRNA(Asn)/Glu-tRNA(Gln) amidotransferase A subunit family amidase